MIKSPPYYHCQPLFIAVAVLAAGIGCSNGEPPKAPSVDVSGKVLMNGEPFTGAAVRFYNADYGGGAFNLNEDGEFSSNAPLTIGKYLISLDRPGANVGNSPAEMSFPKDRSGELPAMYRSATESGFVAELEEGKENDFTFEMTGQLTSKAKKVEGPMVIKPLAEQE